MRTKYGGSVTPTTCPADVTLMSNSQPEVNSSSATRTANDAPTAHPTIPN